MRHSFLLLYALLISALPLQAQPGGDGEIRSERSFLSDHESIAPGSSFTVALHLEHPEDWHSYYRNSGGLEKPPEIQWELPNGFEAGSIQWPVPKVKVGDFGVSFIYPDSLTLLTDIKVSEQAEVGSTATIVAKAQWQICDTLCMDEGDEFEINLPITDSATLNSDSEPFFMEARAKLPVVIDDATFTLKQAPDSVTITVSGVDFETLPTDFIPNQAYWQAASVGGGIEEDGDSVKILLARKTESAFGDKIEQGNKLSGIIVAAGKSYLLPLTEIGSGGDDTPEAEAKAVSFGGLMAILGGMFLGGLILNLMPCVFPVIGLKIMGFVQQAGEDKKKVMLHGIIFTLGVLASFAVLSGILFMFKKGWGYQLENPWVVLSLMILMFLLALNMFGVFEIGSSATSIGGKLQSKQGLTGSFFSGVLATVVATPCSAPFLGAAIGAAIGLPPVLFFTAFGAMALGLSTPYLVLSIFPKLIDFLPRPGAWMESFKQAMSFLLFATAGYLLWVYAGQIGLENLLKPIFGLSVIAIAAWIYGRWNLPSLEKRTRVTALALTIAFAASGFILAKPPEPSALEWKDWTPQVQKELLKEGTPVYIDFTAQWCLTCQVNKSRAYNDEVVKAFNEKGVATLKADKTKPNKDIDKAIKEYGRAAIPVNVLLVPGKQPIILPELLSPKDVLKALESVEDQ